MGHAGMVRCITRLYQQQVMINNTVIAVVEGLRASPQSPYLQKMCPHQDNGSLFFQKVQDAVHAVLRCLALTELRGMFAGFIQHLPEDSDDLHQLSIRPVPLLWRLTVPSYCRFVRSPSLLHSLF